MTVVHRSQLSRTSLPSSRVALAHHRHTAPQEGDSCLTNSVIGQPPASSRSLLWPDATGAASLSSPLVARAVSLPTVLERPHYLSLSSREAFGHSGLVLHTCPQEAPSVSQKLLRTLWCAVAFLLSMRSPSSRRPSPDPWSTDIQPRTSG